MFSREFPFRWPNVVILSLVALVAFLLCSACSSESSRSVILGTTTSTQDSGLLDVLLPEFEKETEYSIKLIAVGSGAAIRMGSRGDVDVLLVHSPEDEEEFMANGHGINRQLIMHNDFILVGPPEDFAGVGQASGVLEALRAIVESGESFVSRGDDSGTHNLEKSLWKEIGIDPYMEHWYIESGQGMSATLQIAGQRSAYTISDRATFITNGSHLDLSTLNEGDSRLVNIYHAIQVNPQRFDTVVAEGAKAFVDFLMSAYAQELISNFGVERFGKALFEGGAGKSEAEVGGH